MQPQGGLLPLAKSRSCNVMDEGCQETSTHASSSRVRHDCHLTGSGSVYCRVFCIGCHMLDLIFAFAGGRHVCTASCHAVEV